MVTIWGNPKHSLGRRPFWLLPVSVSGAPWMKPAAAVSQAQTSAVIRPSAHGHSPDPPRGVALAEFAAFPFSAGLQGADTQSCRLP